jgi:hypothetical protein
MIFQLNEIVLQIWTAMRNQVIVLGRSYASLQRCAGNHFMFIESRLRGETWRYLPRVFLRVVFVSVQMSH